MAREAEAEGKLPWFALVVADYLRDTQHLSLETQGAWIRILCSMHTSSTRGRVIFDKRKLSRWLGTTDDRVSPILDELRDDQNPTGKPTCDFEDLGDGKFVLISRRMEKDERIRQINRANGLKGGAQAWKDRSRLTDSVNRNENRNPNPPVNPKSQSQRTESGEVSPDPSGDEVPKPKKREPKVPLPEIPEELDTPHFRTAWAAFLKFRGEGRFRVTSNAAVILLNKCRKWGVEAAIQSIESSIAGAYRDLYPPRGIQFLNGGTYAKPRRTPAERGEHVQLDRELPTIGDASHSVGSRDRAKAS